MEQLLVHVLGLLLFNRPPVRVLQINDDDDDDDDELGVSPLNVRVALT